MIVPRVFVVRHGETEWSLDGRHTGTTELDLTSNGVQRMRATGEALIGDGKLIIPHRISHVYVSPRLRALRTLELLDFSGRADESKEMLLESTGARMSAKIEITDDLCEWDYGEYEGLTSTMIQSRRAENEEPWDIWRDGCPGGESPEAVRDRLDRLIKRIRKLQKPGLEGSSSSPCTDIVLVAHSHVLRAFAMRWVGEDLRNGPKLLLEAGGVGVLSYEHNDINEPAIMLGASFIVGD